MTSFADDAFPKERLEVLLDPDTAYATADVRVIDGLGDVVAGQVGGTALRRLLPAAEDIRAACREPELGEGRVTAPVELYAPLAEPPTIALRPIEEPEPTPAPDEPAPAGPAAAQPPVPAEAPASTRGAEAPLAVGRIPLEAPDPLSLVDVADETGRVFKVMRADETLELPPGFYRIRHVGPEKNDHVRPGRARVR